MLQQETILGWPLSETAKIKNKMFLYSECHLLLFLFIIILYYILSILILKLGDIFSAILYPSVALTWKLYHHKGLREKSEEAGKRRLFITCN